MLTLMGLLAFKAMKIQNFPDIDLRELACAVPLDAMVAMRLSAVVLDLALLGLRHGTTSAGSASGLRSRSD